MSFHSRFIEMAELSWQNFRTEGHLQFQGEAYEKHGTDYLLFNSTAQILRRATIIRLRGDQSAIFMETPIDYAQDFKQWLRLPFEDIYIQLEQPVAFFRYAPRTPEQLAEWQTDYDNAPSDEERNRLQQLRDNEDPLIRGVLLSSTDNSKTWVDSAGLEHDPRVSNFPLSQAVRVIHAVFFMPLTDFPLNIHSFTMCITPDNRLATAKQFSSTSTLTTATQWLVGMINFLSSPSVKLVFNEPSRELQKARAKKGKPPLPGWHEVTYRKLVHEYSKAKTSNKKWEHSFRYDVRGHFARFTRGRMAGRVVWIPPHQRGLRHQLYRPKGYVLDASQGGTDVGRSTTENL